MRQERQRCGTYNYLKLIEKLYGGKHNRKKNPVCILPYN